MLSVREDELNKISEGDSIGPAPFIDTDLPGPNAKAIIDRDQHVSSPSYGRYYPLVVRRGQGSIIEDVDGNRFLDLAAGIGVCATGHSHPRVVQAIERQARQLIHGCGAILYYPPMTLLMEKLASLAPGRGPKRVFLSNSGTEAIECAFKLARYHTRRQWVISFQGGFHGRTMGALALTCSKVGQQRGFGPLVPMVAHVPYGDVGSIENVLFKHKMAPDEVAAIFVEPVQGEGGYILPEPDFLPKLRALCDRHGILMVADEIQSGMGRTGKWFACQHFGVVPDVVCVAKGIASGMPLGAVIAREEIADWTPGSHASTFGGNPVACAAAMATIELLEGGMMAASVETGEYLRAGLEAIAEKRKVITKVRGLGLMCAVDVINRRTNKLDVKLRSRILSETFSRGVVLLGCGESTIRFCPPLSINAAQIDVALKVFDEAIATVVR